MLDRTLDALADPARRRSAAHAQQRAHVVVAAQQLEELFGGQARVLDLERRIAAVAGEMLREGANAAARPAVVKELAEVRKTLGFGDDDAVQAQRVRRENDAVHV